MIRRSAIILFLLPVLFLSIQASGPGAILIRNAKIVTVTGPVLEKGCLLLENGVISRIAPVIDPPAGATVIEAGGLHVYPGMVALMTAVGLTAYPGSRSEQNENGLSIPFIDAYDSLNPEDNTIAVTRIGGVTTVQLIPGTQSIINGQSIAINLDGNLAGEMLLKRNTGLVINLTVKKENSYPSTLPGLLAWLREKLDKAREHHQKQSASGQTAGKPAEEKRPDPELEALRPVMAGEEPVIFITNDEITLRHAIELIGRFQLRGIIQAGKGALKYAGELAAAKIPVIWAGTTNQPERHEPFDLYFGAAGQLAARGVVLTFTAGGFGGGSNVRNLTVPASLSMAHGLSEEEAIQALTINPARMIGIDDRTGSLEPGKLANAVIWTGSPLQMRSRVHTLIINGRIVPQTSFQTELRDKYAPAVRERIKPK